MENSAGFGYKTEKPREIQTEDPSISTTSPLFETEEEIKGGTLHP